MTVERQAVFRRRRSVAVLAGNLMLVAALTSCGGHFSRSHNPDDGPVSPQAAALAQEYRLGPDGFGKIRLGMTAAEARATGQFVLLKGQGIGGCQVGTEVGMTSAKSGAIWISDVYGVVKIATYAGVRTPEGIGLGSTTDEVEDTYPDTHVELARDMSNGRVQMDDHYRSSVPGNPRAAYRFFVDKNDKVDSILLTLANQDCDVGFTN